MNRGILKGEWWPRKSLKGAEEEDMNDDIATHATRQNNKNKIKKVAGGSLWSILKFEGLFCLLT